jgi:serine phosphatase RsbU (regulator of sigma subunit)/putative methionine-R-sulfoxide reductase with GAF domain
MNIMFANLHLQITPSPWPAYMVVLFLLIMVVATIIVLRRYRSRRRLIKKVAELEMLSVVGRAILEAELDMSALCAHIARQAGQIIDSQTFQIGLFVEEFYCIHYWTVDGRIQETPAYFDIEYGPGIVNWIRQTKQALLVHDFEREINDLPAKPRYISESPPRAAIFIPLIQGEECIGVMAAQSSTPNRFDQDDMRRLTILANQAAAAIAHTRLYQKERSRAAHLELVGQIGLEISRSQNLQELFELVVKLTQETFNFHLVSIFLIDEEDGSIRIQASTSPELLQDSMILAAGQGLVGTAVATQQTIISNDIRLDQRYIRQPNEPEQHTNAEMVLPLIVDGDILGVLDVQTPETGFFTEVEQMTLEALAAETAVAINKIQQLAWQREQAWQTTAQLQVAEAIGQSAHLDELAAAVTRLTPMLLGSQLCAILTWQDEWEQYSLSAIYSIHTGAASRPTQTQFQIGDWSSLDAVHVGQEKLTTERQPEWLQPILNKSAPAITKITILPLSTTNQILGALIVDENDQLNENFRTRQSRDELLDNIAYQTAKALETIHLRTAQQEEAWVNTALFQVAAAVNSLTVLDDILDTITRMVPLLVGVQSCIVLIWDEDRGLFHAGPSYGIGEMERGLFETLEIDQAEFQALSKKQLEQLVSTGDYFGIQLPEWLVKVLHTKSAYLFPLNARGKLVGSLMVAASDVNRHLLSPRRLNILTGVAHQAATAVVNHQLYKEAARRSQLEQELAVAREIQVSLIPSGSPDIPGCNVASYWQAARQVSGDFYDFLPLGNGRWGIIIADVSDKGVPAALFMALSRTILRTIAFNRTDPASALIRANQIIDKDTQTDLFVTVFYAILDTTNNTVCYANGGHNPPLMLHKNGEISLLKSAGVALGVMPDIEVESQLQPFTPGDTLILYTDGITEAINEDYDEFGLKRLSMVVKNHVNEDADQIVQHITKSIAQHTGDTPQFDDMTMVVIKNVSGA